MFLNVNCQLTVTDNATCVFAAANELAECPVWCPRDNVLWWIDITERQLWSYDPVAEKARSWPLPDRPASFALKKDGGFLFAFRRGFATCEHPAGKFDFITPRTLELGEERFNDGRADRHGRFWVGSMDRALTSSHGKLYRVSADGTSVEPMDAGFAISNGLGWSPDDGAMFFTETSEARIYRFDFDLRTGSLTNRAVFVQFSDRDSHPDGLTVDSAGYVLSVLYGHGRIERYAPNGELESSIHLPVSRITSCAFGGHDLKTLYVTTARMGMTESELSAEPGAGGLWAIRLPCPGQTEALFGQAPALSTA